MKTIYIICEKYEEDLDYWRIHSAFEDQVKAKDHCNRLNETYMFSEFKVEPCELKE